MRATCRQICAFTLTRGPFPIHSAFHHVSLYPGFLIVTVNLSRLQYLNCSVGSLNAAFLIEYTIIGIRPLESRVPREDTTGGYMRRKDDEDGGDGEWLADQQMTTISRHSFGDSEKTVFSISIIENMKEDYGLFVWPCSIVLAEYVWQQKLRFSRNSVVELGAGTCLPGLMAAKVGSIVTLTDDANRLEVLENMRRVCELNKLKCKVSGLTWGVWDASIFSLHPKIILGADVLYDAHAFDDLFATVAFLLQSNPGSVFITTYHNRSGHHLIEFLMVKWGLKCVKLLDGFSILPSDKAAKLSGNIQLAEIVLKHEQIEETSSSSAR